MPDSSIFADYQVEAFSFIPEFQLRALALAIRDRAWLRHHRTAVDPRFWESAVHRDVVTLALRHFDKFQQTPDMVELADLLEAELATDAVKARSRDEYIAVMTAIFAEEAQGTPAATTERVLRFAKHQAVKAAIMKAIPLLPSEDYAGIEELMRAALRVDQSAADLGSDFFLTYGGVLHQSWENLRRPIPTGQATLDRRLGGGIGRTEFGLVIADTSIGKTFVMVNFSGGAVLAGHRVYYASLEDPTFKLEDRFLRFFTGMDRLTVRADGGVAADRSIQQIASICRGWLTINWFPPEVTTLAQIREAVRRKEEELGARFDLICLDYLDRMAPPRKRDKTYEEIKENADQILGWIGEEGKALWTGSQVDSDGMKAKTATHAHAAGWKGKSAGARIVLTLNQSQAEAENKPLPILRIFVDKVTDEARRMADRYYADHARSRLLLAEDSDAGPAVAVPAANVRVTIPVAEKKA